MSKIPVIDLGEIGIHNHEVGNIARSEWERVAAEFNEAFTKTGFLYMKNHGMTQEKFYLVNEVTDKFFSLPMNVKRKYYRKTIEKYNRYVGPSDETLNRNTALEFRECYNVRQLSGTFPEEEVPLMRPVVKDIAEEFEELCNRVFKVLAIALDLDDEDFFLKVHEGPLTPRCETLMRFLNYPPVKDNMESGVIRFAEHADYTTCTILYQDDVGGLEVKTVDNEWMEATPIPGTLLFNVGEMLEIWSAGKFPATKHRVLISEDDRKNKTRRTFGFFVGPDENCLIKPLDGSTTYKPVVCKQHLEKRFFAANVIKE